MVECQKHVFPIKLASVENLKTYLYPSMIFPTRHPNYELSVAHNQVTGGNVTLRTVPADAINYIYGWIIGGCSINSAGGDAISLSVNRVAPLADLILTQIHCGINRGVAMSHILLVPIQLTGNDVITLTAQPATMLGWAGLYYTDEPI